MCDDPSLATRSHGRGCAELLVPSPGAGGPWALTCEGLGAAGGDGVTAGTAAAQPRSLGLFVWLPSP